MHSGEFRFAFYAGDYEPTVAFYRDDLGLTVSDAWDRGPEDKGTIFDAASGMIEILKRPAGVEFVRPAGALVIEVDDVDAWHERARQRELPIRQEPTDQPWGHRDLRLADPNGLQLVLFSPLDAP